MAKTKTLRCQDVLKTLRFHLRRRLKNGLSRSLRTMVNGLRSKGMLASGCARQANKILNKYGA